MTPLQQTLTAFAQTKMEHWGLTAKGWVFGWNTRRQALGVCRMHRKRIELSSFLIEALGEEEGKDVVLHEIAHALDFETRGRSAHDRIWRIWAMRVGAKPERCHEASPEVEAVAVTKSKYTLRCPNGHEFASHRRVKRLGSCGTCCPRFNPAFRLEQIQNY